MTDTSIVTQSDAPVVLNPATGELVPLDSPTDVLAQYLAGVREFEDGLRSAKRQVADELLQRMDHEGTWTVHLPGITVEGDGPGRVMYDAEELHRRLDDLVDHGHISAAARDKAVEVVTTYKAKAAGVKALHKLGDEVAEAIDACSHPSEKPRQVRVKPK